MADEPAATRTPNLCAWSSVCRDHERQNCYCTCHPGNRGPGTLPYGQKLLNPTPEVTPVSNRYDRCDDTCTTDCGHCKGAGRPDQDQPASPVRYRDRIDGTLWTPEQIVDAYESHLGRLLTDDERTLMLAELELGNP